MADHIYFIRERERERESDVSTNLIGNLIRFSYTLHLTSTVLHMYPNKDRFSRPLSSHHEIMYIITEEGTDTIRSISGCLRVAV